MEKRSEEDWRREIGWEGLNKKGCIKMGWVKRSNEWCDRR